MEEPSSVFRKSLFLFFYPPYFTLLKMKSFREEDSRMNIPRFPEGKGIWFFGYRVFENE